MNVGINGVSAGEGDGCSLNRVEAGEVLQVLAVGQAFCLSPHITPGSRARSMARSRTHAAFLSPVSKWCQNDPTFHHSLVQAFILTPSNWGLSVSIKMGKFCPWVICVPRLACGSRAHDECSDLYWFVLVVIVILKQEHRTLGENRLKRV